MPSQATITTDTGPAVQNTALVLHEVTKVVIDIARLVLEIDCYEGHKEFDLHSVVTLTDAINADVHTIVVST